MEKYIYDTKTGWRYVLRGDYYFPDISDNTEEQEPIGIYGQRRLKYLKEHKEVCYALLSSTGELYAHLMDVDTRARGMLAKLEKEMAKNEGVTDELKLKNQMEWVGRMQNIRNRALEIINREIIYA